MKKIHYSRAARRRCVPQAEVSILGYQRREPWQDKTKHSSVGVFLSNMLPPLEALLLQSPIFGGRAYGTEQTAPPEKNPLLQAVKWPRMGPLAWIPTCAVAAVSLHSSTCNLPRRPNDSGSSLSLRTDLTHIIFSWRQESLSPLLFATESLSPSCRIPTSQCQSRASSRIAYLSNPQLLLQVFIQHELCRLTKRSSSSAFLLPLSTILGNGYR